MAEPLLLTGSLLPVLAALLLEPRLTRELLRDLRVPRILHYVALGGLGMALFLRQSGQAGRIPDPDLLWRFLLFAVALSYAAVFAIVTNNLEDVAADRVTNPDRPLVLGTVNPAVYLRAGVLSLLASPAGRRPGRPPDAGRSPGDHRRLLRLLVPSLPAETGADPLEAADRSELPRRGRLRLRAGRRRLPGVSPSWALYLLVPLSLAANFVDLKDTEGDRRTGVATLPVLLGERVARHCIAVSTVVAYSAAGFLLAIPWVHPLNAGVAALHLYGLYRKPYEEGRVFAVYVSALFALDGILLL